MTFHRCSRVAEERFDAGAVDLKSVGPHDAAVGGASGAVQRCCLSTAGVGARTAGMMEFRILGPLEVLVDGGALDLGGPKQRALLAFLVIEANRVVSSDRLIDALWEEEPPETVQKALQVYVSQVRKVLGQERVRTVAPGYLLRVEAKVSRLEKRR